MHDLLIKNGRIVDGSGLPSFRGDVAVNDGVITEVGKVRDGALRTIDADGLVVAPGFVDMHTHYDAQVFWDPVIESSGGNGVTTVVMGNCGFTLAPCRPRDHEYMGRTLARVEDISATAILKGVTFRWDSFGEYLAAIDRPMGINVAANVGHTAVRRYVMGDDASARAATPQEIDAMKAHIREAMAAGACGLTTSRGASHWGPFGEPVPSRLAALQEVYELAMAMAPFGNGNFECVGMSDAPEDRELLIRISLELGRQVNWNELNQMSRRPDAWKEALRFMEEANRRGAQIYGIARCQTGDLEFDLMDNSRRIFMYPGWREVLTKPVPERLALLRDSAARQRLKESLEGDVKTGPSMQWKTTAILGVAKEANRPFVGRTLEQIGREQGKHPLDALLDLAVGEELLTEFAFLGFMNDDQEAVGKIIQSPYAVIGISDAGAHLVSRSKADYGLYCLATWVRERRIFSLEHAVMKLTFMPASLMGFHDRGLVRQGMAADISIFDAETVAPGPQKRVKDLPGEGPRVIARGEGIPYVIVNGQVAFENGRATGTLGGGLLRSNRYRKGGR